MDQGRKMYRLNTFAQKIEEEPACRKETSIQYALTAQVSREARLNAACGILTNLNRQLLSNSRLAVHRIMSSQLVGVRPLSRRPNRFIFGRLGNFGDVPDVVVLVGHDPRICDTLQPSVLDSSG
jgi:hypothetical protein